MAETGWTSRSPAETAALAAALGRALAEGAAAAGVLALVGELGAGKTLFVKGLAEGLGLAPAEVSSPTFVLANEYALPGPRGPRRLVHADLYRLADEREVEAAGLLDWLDAETLLAVEWGDRFPEALPADRLEIRLAASGAQGRAISLRAGGRAAAALLAAWRERLRPAP